MFRREFKVKNNSQLRSNEKKKLWASLIENIPNLKESHLNSSLPLKEPILQLKIVTFQRDVAFVYICQGKPLFINVNGVFVPTVFFMWLHPDVFHICTTTSFVLNKIVHGATLMAPGIISIVSACSQEIKEGNIISINVPENQASLAIGICLMNGDEMLKEGRHGKAVDVINFHGDKLCKLATETVEMPIITTEIETKIETEDSTGLEDQGEDVCQVDCEKELNSITNPDELLINSFLRSIKVSNNQIQLPLLTNVFYKHHMLKSIPNSSNFDIKKTKHKKLSKFLSSMEEEGIIKVETTQSNVQSIIHIDYEHPRVSNYVDKPSFDAKGNCTPVCEEIFPLEFTENFVINSPVQELFVSQGYHQGDAMSAQDVRKVVTHYVKTNNLQDPNSKSHVIPDHILSKIIKNKTNSVDWRYVIDKVTNSMRRCYEIRRNNLVINSGKGNIPLIEIHMKVRTGNKKVTVIDNLEVYGINLQKLARDLQHILATSTNVSKDPSRKTLQLQVQGSHATFIINLLTEKYFIPKKYFTDHNPGAKPSGI